MILNYIHRPKLNFFKDKGYKVSSHNNKYLNLSNHSANIIIELTTVAISAADNLSSCSYN